MQLSHFTIEGYDIHYVMQLCYPPFGILHLDDFAFRL